MPLLARLRMLAAVVLGTMVMACASAQTLDDLKQRAAGGDTAAMVQVGLHYSRDVEPPDRAEAIKWFRMAADKGDASGANYIGVELVSSEPVDFTEGAKWFRRALELDPHHAGALTNLGSIALVGAGVDRNDAEGLRLLSAAADHGVAPAILTIGIWHQQKGVRRDIRTQGSGRTEFDEALKWFRRAADAGNAMAMGQIADLYEQDYLGVPDPSESFRWRLRAAEAGNVMEMDLLADRYDRGVGVAKDARVATAWYEKAARLGGISAMQELASRYHEGIGTGRNLVLAREWYAKAVAKGDAFAILALAEMLRTGEGGPRRLADAIALYWRAIERGDQDVAARLGQLYATGTDVSQNDEEAYFLFTIAAYNNDYTVPKPLYAKVRERIEPSRRAVQDARAEKWIAAHISERSCSNIGLVRSCEEMRRLHPDFFPPDPEEPDDN